MLCRWFLTVCSLMNIFSAISLFLKPCATSATISRSRWLSGERSRSRPCDEDGGGGGGRAFRPGPLRGGGGGGGGGVWGRFLFRHNLRNTAAGRLRFNQDFPAINF